MTREVADTEAMDFLHLNRVAVKPAESLTNAEDALDAAWEEYSRAVDEIVDATGSAMFARVLAELPDVVEIWVRMDTSHEPEHGHMDALITSDRRDLLPAAHDEDWLVEVEELAWDLGHIAAARFTRDEDGERRLHIARH